MTGYAVFFADFGPGEHVFSAVRLLLRFPPAVDSPPETSPDASVPPVVIVATSVDGPTS